MPDQNFHRSTEEFLRRQEAIDRDREPTMAEVLREVIAMRDQFAEEIKLLRHDHNHLRNDFDNLSRHFHRSMAQEELRGGLLVEPDKLSLLEVQIFFKETLTTKERQGRRTNWSLRLEPSVGGRRLIGAINVPLYPPDEFETQVYENTGGDVPAILAAAIDWGREHSDALMGMLNLRTKGNGTPRSRRQFVVVRDYLTNHPFVQIWVDTADMTIREWKPGKGTQMTRAKWYGTWTPKQAERERAASRLESAAGRG